MTKIRNSKVLSLLLILLLTVSLLFALSSCGGSSKLSKGENESNEQFAAKVLKTDLNLTLKFIAASRGHDMTAENFEDTDEVKPNPDTDAAKKILLSAIEKQSFDYGKDTVTEFANNLTDAEIFKVVEHLGTTVNTESDPGIFDYILIGIGIALGWITDLVGGYYIIAILIFAVFVEILMSPMAIKQQKNSIGMAKLRPQIAKIEKKYAGRTDQITLRKKQEEIMALQQKEGFSPFSGCLPLILQLIIVGFILYPIIQNPLRYMLGGSDEFSAALATYASAPRAAGGLGMTLSSGSNVIEILSNLRGMELPGLESFALFNNGADCLNAFNSISDSIPNFTLFTMQIGRVPSLGGMFSSFEGFFLVLIPVLNVALQLVTMKLTKMWSGNGGMPAAPQDGQSKASFKIMNLVMPLMTLYIMFQVSALIGIYWLFRSGLSLLKSFIMSKVMPIPKYTEAELKEMEKAQKATEKAQKEALKDQPKFRSLHYIDEDDYDELPEVKGKSEQKQSNAPSDIPEIKD